MKSAKIEIQGVKYQPWKGPLYDCDDKRVLVLGESFYHGEGGEVPSCINQIGPYNASNNKFDEKARRTWARHFHKIQKLFFHSHGSDPKEFWGRVVYYNYIQESVGDKPGVRPTKVMWQNAAEPFRAVLMALKPSRVLVLGNGLWGNLLDSPMVMKPKNKFPRLLDDAMGPVLRVVGHPASRDFYKKLASYQATVRELLDHDTNTVT